MRKNEPAIPFLTSQGSTNLYLTSKPSEGFANFSKIVSASFIILVYWISISCIVF